MVATKGRPVSVRFSLSATTAGDQLPSDASNTQERENSTPDSPTSEASTGLGVHAPVVDSPKLVFVEEIDLEGLSDLAQEGFVELELLISPEGKVVRTKVLKSTVSSDFFARTEEAFKRAEFIPGKVNGVPEFAKYRFRVVFSASYPR